MKTDEIINKIKQFESMTRHPSFNKESHFDTVMSWFLALDDEDKLAAFFYVLGKNS